MQPHLLGNEFTHLEFPRRVQRKEVGKKMLYRDFTMSGWWVSYCFCVCPTLMVFLCIVKAFPVVFFSQNPQ